LGVGAGYSFVIFGLHKNTYLNLVHIILYFFVVYGRIVDTYLEEP
jgi:hypothetical protein